MREGIENCSITPMSQRSFASAEYAMKKKRTRREKFLADMERVVPWSRLIAVIEPLYPTSGRVGRQPIGVSRMLRMYCLQQWYGLADEALEDALYDSQALRGFARHRSGRADDGARRHHAAQVPPPAAENQRPVQRRSSTRSTPHLAGPRPACCAKAPWWTRP